MVKLFMWLCAVYAKLAGWKFYGGIPAEERQCVIIAAPHTSAWDFIIGMAGFRHYRSYSFRYFAKRELFWYPLKRVL